MCELLFLVSMMAICASIIYMARRIKKSEEALLEFIRSQERHWKRCLLDAKEKEAAQVRRGRPPKEQLADSSHQPV